MTHSSSHELTDRLAQRLHEELGLRAVMAAEIEFYLHGAATHPDFETASHAITHALALENLTIGTMEKERGEEQYEIALLPGLHPSIAAEDTLRLKRIVEKTASTHGLTADFRAKPFPDQPGSGLHIHAHLINGTGHNVCFKEDGEYSPELRHAIGGLLATACEAMPFFAPTRAAYARFVAGYNVPLTVSWGANNRTVAVRLPPKNSGLRHLEHRIAGADANPSDVIAAVLAGMHHGLSKRIEPSEQVFGDASLPIYSLPPLPRDYRHAMHALSEGKIIASYFGEGYCREAMKSLLANAA